MSYVVSDIVADSNSDQALAIIIGAGPAGLTAAYELLKKTSIKPIVLERSSQLGGLAQTVNYKGNRIDIGGHRFFSKSDRVMAWWLDKMPLQSSGEAEHWLAYQGATRALPSNVAGVDPDQTDQVMLVRNRKSRIYFMRKFFDYPISLSLSTISNLGLWRTFKVGLSYLYSSVFQIKPENNLAEFFTNRFGKELYLTFFKSYTEKVWGVPCSEISAAWGAQRVKGLSLWKALWHFLKRGFANAEDVRQKETETSLIEKFMYPKYGPGQMWEIVTNHILEMGGALEMQCEVTKVFADQDKITAVEVFDHKLQKTRLFSGQYYFSTMAIKDLICALQIDVPEEIKAISQGLSYRDFITVGLLVERLSIQETNGKSNKPISDNWIYVQEPDVKLGRLQIFNNWSPYMISDPNKVWLGLEYFCEESEEIWHYSDQTMAEFAAKELEKIGIIKASDVIDTTVIRMPKTYPGYFGTYDRFEELRQYIDRFQNLYLIGRNGMHKYNNQDHSMLTAMAAVENIVQHVSSKDNIWAINTELEYHEEKTS